MKSYFVLNGGANFSESWLPSSYAAIVATGSKISPILELFSAKLGRFATSSEYINDMFMGKRGIRTTCSGLEWNEMLGLLHQLKKDGKLKMYLFICCGCYFGLRAGDLLRLRWVDIIDHDDFYITEKKTGKTRKITINATVKEALNHVRAILIKKRKYQHEGFVFFNRLGGALSLSYINKQLHKLLAHYKIKTQNPSSHLCRKTFGRRVWSQDYHSERSLIYLSEIFGHASVATTRRYLGITQQQIADVFLKL